jgi:hypothetical protein
MPYALQSLLRIRLMREDRASGELVAARRAVADANDALAARRREREEFERTREERRDRLYEGVIGRTVDRERLDLVREGVSKIDEEAAAKAEKVLRAEREVKEREKEAERARAVFTEATRNRMKIDEHRADWTRHEAEEQEKREETELEDFTRRPKDD